MDRTWDPKTRFILDTEEYLIDLIRSLICDLGTNLVCFCFITKAWKKEAFFFKKRQKKTQFLNLFFRKQSEDWSWSDDQSWSDVKKNEETKPKKSTNNPATKKLTTTTNEDLLIDFGGASKIEAKKAEKTEDSSWANWENDAWESLNKKD